MIPYQDYLVNFIRNFEIVESHDKNVNDGSLDYCRAEQLFIRNSNSRGMTPVVKSNYNYMHHINNDGKYSLGEATLISVSRWPDNYDGFVLDEHLLHQDDFKQSQTTDALFNKYALNKDGIINKSEVITVDNKTNKGNYEKQSPMDTSKEPDHSLEEPISSPEGSNSILTEQTLVKNTKLSVGAITGIILACLFFIGVITMTIIVLTTTKKRQKLRQEKRHQQFSQPDAFT